MTKNKKESHYLIIMMIRLLNYPDTHCNTHCNTHTHAHTHTHKQSVRYYDTTRCIMYYYIVLQHTVKCSDVNDEEQKGISLSDHNDDTPT
jgi:hypothetical protein